MEINGRLCDWHDDEGYGFIVPEHGGARLFVHILEFRTKYPRPRDGDSCVCTPVTGSDGRARAKGIRRPHLDKPKARLGFPLLVLAGFAAWIAIQTTRKCYPEALALYLAVVNGFSFLQYARDKRLAKNKEFRISEARLHGVDLLGGWPAAFVAQHLYRHKVSKLSFRMVFLLTVLLNTGILVYLKTVPGYWETGTFGEYLPALMERIECHAQFVFSLKEYL
jgi:uncharacterized membrane protein YsdA (DUF1294 family)/cold shock CspA family protein